MEPQPSLEAWYLQDCQTPLLVVEWMALFFYQLIKFLAGGLVDCLIGLVIYWVSE